MPYQSPYNMAVKIYNKLTIHIKSAAKLDIINKKTEITYI